MKNSFQPNNASKNSRRKIIVAIVLVALIYGVDVLSHGFLRSVARTSASGISSAFFRVSAGIDGSGFFSTRAKLAKENDAFRSELATTKELLARYSGLKSENDELRAILALTDQAKGTAAPIISSIISSPYGTFAIGAGTAQGIDSGAPVFSSGGFLLGVVTDPGARTSLVQELFSSGVKTDALIGGVAAVVEGTGGSNAKASLPRGTNIQPGAVVMAPHYSAPIGIVGSIATSSSAASDEVYIALPTALSAMRYVYVGTIR